MKAELVRFYGLSLSEVRDLPLTDFSDLFQSMQILKAREILTAYKIQDWPNTKEKARNQEWAKIEKLANLKSNVGKRVTNDELKAILGSR